MSTSTDDGKVPILVEFTTEAGQVQKASLISLLRRNREELTEKSEQALDGAMGAIRHMAQRVSDLHDDIPVEFSQAQVEFGVKLVWEVGAVLSKAGTEGAINVKLTWQRPVRSPRLFHRLPRSAQSPRLLSLHRRRLRHAVNRKSTP